MVKNDFNDMDGVWRTVGGRRIFIRTGQSLSDAMKKSGKFKSAKKTKIKEGNPIKDLADDRIKEKENTLANDKAILSEMQKRGIDEIQGWKKEDFENRIKKNEEYLKTAKAPQNEEEEKKKIGGWKINEQGKKEYYERELADNERGYWTKENGQRVFKENPNYKEDKKELNLSQKQINEGNRLNNKAENGVRDDVKAFLSGKENYDGSREDFIRDLSDNWGVDRDKVEEILHDENVKHPRNFKTNQQKSIEKNMPEGAKFSKMLEESNVKTFADEIKEQNKIETISKAEYDKMPNDYKGTLKELVDTVEFRGENKKDLIKQYEKMGYDVNKDKTILVNEKGGTVLKPVKISDSNEKYSIDYFKQRGVEIKDSVPEGYVKLEGAATAPKGYEWYSNGKSRFGGEYKNALVKKENTSSSINNAIRRKAYQKYLKEHPASKITFEDFKDMNKMK